MSDHKMVFGKRCKILKSAFGRKIKEKRNFPKRKSYTTIQYIKEYFYLNNYFVESNYG